MLAALVFAIVLVGIIDVADGLLDVLRFFDRLGYDNWRQG